MSELCQALKEYEALADDIRTDMTDRKVVVTQDQFNRLGVCLWLSLLTHDRSSLETSLCPCRWLCTEKDLISKLEDAEIDLSCKSDLFETWSW